MDDELKEQLIQELLIEGFEGLDQYDQEMLKLENGDGTKSTLNNIFRIIHTIKGSSGCVGFSKIEKLAHDGENLLSVLRDGNVEVSSDMVSVLLGLSDALRELFNNLEVSGDEGAKEFSSLQEALIKLQKPSAKRECVKEENDKGQPKLEVVFEKDADEEQRQDNKGSNSELAKQADAVALEQVDTGQKNSPTIQKSSVVDSAIRVNVSQLDKVMNLVGELVLTRNQILQFTGESEQKELASAAQRLNIITTELQEGVMKTRMQPIGNIWSKFPRIVRDLSKELGKQVEIEMVGKETELDRTIIEAIKDPLTHIIRNAVDHGVETADEREGNGKNPCGNILLKAYHEGGQVNIEIIDDGRGISAEKVKSKAIEKGVLSSEEALRLSEKEAYSLIFSPGFSTAGKVTNVSGRGVGMDVVKTNIEKIGGSVDVNSSEGNGTTIKIKIPLTLAIIPALIVTTRNERFAIPQVSLLELVRLEEGNAANSIEMIYGSPVYRLRGNLLPLIYLDKELRLRDKPKDRRENEYDDGVLNIVVLQADGKQFGLVVDDINDTEEIVVKPLGKQLKQSRLFAGATIMGDGQVALILDVMGLAQEAKVVTPGRVKMLFNDAVDEESEEPENSRYLVFNSTTGRRMAMPLSIVDRLEEIPSVYIENSSDGRVVQYRGQIMPLINVGNLDGHVTLTEDEQLQVIVYSGNGNSVGLVVGEIDDIIEQELTIQRKSLSPDIIGSAIIKDKVTGVLDVENMIKSADPSFYL